MTYDKTSVCVNCMMTYADHAGTKCLYEPTIFSPVECVVCRSTEYTAYTTNVIESIRYFMCIRCNQAHRYGYHDRTDLHRYRLIRNYLLTDVLISYWKTHGDY